MKSVFEVFLGLGFDHILDPEAYDHILFVVALCAVYQLKEWRKVAVLVTAFTVGHSLTLALAAMEIIRFPAQLIELLIPVTILLTALYNCWNAEGRAKTAFLRVPYFLALVFGLIHGMGFSNFFRSTLMPGQEDQLLKQLFAFNIGVELGQLVIVAGILVLSFLAFNVFKIKQRDWTLFLSGAAAGVALVLIKNVGF
ncbi:MAG: HupE/UreJ family protein [Bacteroidetes bacterium]|nr:MAG: HupE/UreJ family protein [Bacteroidota bacterium]